MEDKLHFWKTSCIVLLIACAALTYTIVTTPAPVVCPVPTTRVLWSEDFDFSKDDFVGGLYTTKDQTVLLMSRIEFDVRENLMDKEPLPLK